MRSLSRQERLVVLSLGGVTALGIASLLYTGLRPVPSADLVVPWTMTGASNPARETGAGSTGAGPSALGDHLAAVGRRLESGDRGGRAPARRININTAPQTELILLEGIGPARARAIVEYRTAHGPFVRVDEVERVPGIGPATLERIRGYICTE